MKFKFILIIIFFLCSFAKADDLDNFIKNIDEYDKVASWVRKSTNNKLGINKAKSIVIDTYIYSHNKNLNPTLVLAVMKLESRFNSNAKSHGNAKGLLQVVPFWHKDKLAGRDPFNQKVSIEVGITILDDCIRKHKGNIYKSLSCYSGGGGKVYYNTVINYQNDLINNLKKSEILLALNNQ